MIFESQYRIKTALLILLQTSFQYLIQQKLSCIHIWFGDFDEFAMYEPCSYYVYLHMYYLYPVIHCSVILTSHSLAKNYSYLHDNVRLTLYTERTGRYNKIVDKELISSNV